MEQRLLGHKSMVSALGLGCMGYPSAFLHQSQLDRINPSLRTAAGSGTPDS